MFVQNVIKKRFHVVMLSPAGVEVERDVEAESEASAYLSLPADMRGKGWELKEIRKQNTPRA